MSPEETLSIQQAAHAAANAARTQTLRHFRAPLIVEDKSDGAFDPVTEADRAGERAIRDVLAKFRPNDSILGEEYAPVEGSSGLTWVLDPIDGTRGYVSGTPTWGTLISLRDETGPLFGIIDQPYIGERFWGGFGAAGVSGPTGERTLSTSRVRDLAQATLLTTFPEVGRPQDRLGFEAVRDVVQLTRYGMDCYGYALAAIGSVELVIEAGLQEYDISAPVAVVQAAGGLVTNWRGGPAHEGGQAIAAANAEIHAAALALLEPYADD